MIAKSILVGIDFSPASLDALETARLLARHNSARLTLLHVLDGFPYEAVYSGSRALQLRGQIDAAVEAHNQKMLALLPARQPDDRDVEVVTVTGKPHEQLLAAAQERAVELIVIGLPPRTLVDRLLGSTAERVLAGSPIAVLVVPGKAAEPIRSSESQTKAVREMLSSQGPTSYEPPARKPRK
jgi:universal stress protein A